MLVEKNK